MNASDRENLFRSVAIRDVDVNILLSCYYLLFD